MTTQKILCLLMALSLVLTACGTTVVDDPKDGSTTTTTTTQVDVGNGTLDEGEGKGEDGTTTTQADAGSETPGEGKGEDTTTKTTDKTAGTTKESGHKTATTSTYPSSTKASTSSKTSTTTTTKGDEDVGYDFFRLGNGLTNSYLKLKNEKKLTIAFMGGSVTYGIGCNDLSKSFRIYVKDWLQKQFPDAAITEINAAYPSACSAYGVYAVDDFVIAKNADLVFLEYGVNDKYAKSRYTIEQVKANYETILRKLYRADATCDVVALYTTDSTIATTAHTEPLYEHAAAQEEVAKYYGIPSINMGWELVDRYALSKGIAAKKWATFFSDSVHATSTGNQGYGKIITECLSSAFSAAKASGVTTIKNKTQPAAKSNDLSMNTKYVKADALRVSSAWKLSSDNGYPVISTGTASADLTYTFVGTGISLFLDGTGWDIEFSVDGGKTQSTGTLTGYYHLPLPIVSGLSNGEHTITIKAPATVTASNKFSIKAILVRQ